MWARRRMLRAGETADINNTVVPIDLLRPIRRPVSPAYG